MKQRFSSRTPVFFLAFFSLFFVGTSLSSIESNLQEDISEIVTSVGVSPKRSALIIACLEDGRRWVSGKDRLEFPYPPASTAKIPHTLIALEDISTYWLDGPLEISAEQQVTFLKALALVNFPLSSRTYENAKAIMMEDCGNDWSLYAKTGFSNSIGWYVGWVEIVSQDDKKNYIFAFNLDIDSWDDLPKRKEVVREAFHCLGILPKEGD